MDKAGLLRQIAESAHLREGAAGVEAVLRAVYRAQHRPGTEPLTARAASRLVRLPLPVLTALRRELEKADVLEPGPYLRLTEAAAQQIGADWGWATLDSLDSLEPAPPTTDQPSVPIGAVWQALLNTLRKHFPENPGVDVTLDQSHCTPETNVRRVALMYEDGALAGKRVLILGDDDSVSVAIALAGKTLSPSGKLTQRLTALDTDERILNHLRRIAVEEGVEVETVAHDVREPLPEGLAGAFDTVTTDPPYTLPGLTLFVSRAIEALGPDGGQIYLHFGHRPPDEQLAVQSALAGMGLVIERLVPSFNEYVGAGVLAGVSDLYVLRTTGATAPLVEGVYAEKLYTGQVRPTLRKYVCTRCRVAVTVGGEAGGQFATIEVLKSEGCPECGGSTFRMVSRSQVPDST